MFTTSRIHYTTSITITVTITNIITITVTITIYDLLFSIAITIAIPIGTDEAIACLAQRRGQRFWCCAIQVALRV